MLDAKELNAMTIGELSDYCEANHVSVRIEEGKITGLESQANRDGDF